MKRTRHRVQNLLFFDVWVEDAKPKSEIGKSREIVRE